MSGRILPFLVTQSKEKLTDRGHLAIIDEFITCIGFKDQISRLFPKPGSGRGIEAYDYIRTLMFHLLDGGRYLEDIQAVKNDVGFNELIKIKRMPGSDAVGDWLRRTGGWGLTSAVDKVIDYSVKQYLANCESDELTFDPDATLIVSEKGDAEKSYKGFTGYHPMLGFLSDGEGNPICSYVKFRHGNASPQVDILESLQHTETLLRQGQQIKYFRSDSAAYQSKIVDYCNDHGIYYTITADMDASVRDAILSIPSNSWNPLHDRKDGFKTGREVSETIHTMNENNHSFRLIVQRELIDEPSLFECWGNYKYYCIITNIPEEENNSEEVIWHHNRRGNAEKYIEDSKYGLKLRFVPCGQYEANAMYFMIGMLTYNLIKLMQILVLPKRWLKKTILGLRNTLFRIVAKVTKSGHQIKLQVNKTLEEIEELILIRERIYQLSIA